MEVDNIEAAKRMVERGLGVALLHTAVADAIDGGSLREIELIGTATIDGGSWRSNVRSPTAWPFLETLWDSSIESRS